MFLEKLSPFQWLNPYERLLAKSMNRNYPFVKPLKMSIMLTSRCNSRCSYCDSWEKGNRSGKEITVEEIMQIYTAAKNLGVQEVSLTGGEPLLRDDLEDIIGVLSQGLRVVLTTNGILLTPKRIERLVQSGLSTLVLSLDSLEPQTYQRSRGVPFQFVERALESLGSVTEKKYGITVGVNCVVSRYNIGHLEQFSREFFRKLPQTGWITFLAYDGVFVKNDELTPIRDQYPVLLQEIERLIALKNEGYFIMNSKENLWSIPEFLFHRQNEKKWVCSSGFMAIWIDSDMALHPCYQLPAIADLRQENLTDIWFSEKMKIQRAKMMRMECAGCSCVFHKSDPFKISVSDRVKQFFLKKYKSS